MPRNRSYHESIEEPDFLSPKALQGLKVLGLCWHSSNYEAKQRYRALSLIHHPDKAQTERDRILSTDRQVQLNAAWEELSQILPDERSDPAPYPVCCQADPMAAEEDEVEQGPLTELQIKIIKRMNKEEERLSKGERGKKRRAKTSDGREFCWPPGPREGSAEWKAQQEATWSVIQELRIGTPRADLLEALQKPLDDLQTARACLLEMLDCVVSTTSNPIYDNHVRTLRHAGDVFDREISLIATVVSSEGFWLPKPTTISNAGRIWFTRRPKASNSLNRPFRKFWAQISRLYGDFYRIAYACPRDKASEKMVAAAQKMGTVALGLPEGWWSEDEDNNTNEMPDVVEYLAYAKECRMNAARHLLRILAAQQESLEKSIQAAQVADRTVWIDGVPYCR